MAGPAAEHPVSVTRERCAASRLPIDPPPTIQTRSIRASLIGSPLVTAVALACASAFLFGATSVAIRIGLRQGGDAELGALVSVFVGFVVCALAAAIAGEGVPLGDTFAFFLAGLFAPGVSQVLFFRAIQDSGAARVSVVVGTAPLVSVAIAITLLDEPVQAGLITGAVLIVLGGSRSPASGCGRTTSG